MLYLTTREKFDAFTPSRTLQADTASDGGMYVPYRMPVFDKEPLDELLNLSFGQVVAELLNQFFGGSLSGWDVDSCVGKHPVKVAAVGNRIYAAQLWQNLDGSYSQLEKTLAGRIPGYQGQITSWLKIAIRISTLFGIFAEMKKAGLLSAEKPDIAVSADDFAIPMSAWYARQMGLPIGTIICSCREKSGVWELLHLGEMKTDADRSLLQEIERLVFGTLGMEEAKHFSEVVNRQGTYKLLPVDAETLRTGMFCSVIGARRSQEVIPMVFRTNAYSLSPDAAAPYAALMDYRAKIGSNQDCLLLEDSKP